MIAPWTLFYTSILISYRFPAAYKVKKGNNVVAALDICTFVGRRVYVFNLATP
jgi:hypothetical protein